MSSNRKKVNAGLIGLGAFADDVVPDFYATKSLNLVSCFDIDKKKTLAYAKKHKLVSCTDLKQLVSSPFIQAVFITSPNHLHKLHALAAAEAGMHAFIEKPLAVNTKEGIKIISAFEKKSLVLMSGHNIRKMSNFQLIKQILSYGYLGKVLNVECCFNRKGYLTSGSWRENPKFCPGSPLPNIGIHLLDIMLYLFGKVKKASSFIRKIGRANNTNNSVSIIEFKSGTLATLISNYVGPFEWHVNIYGELGKISLNDQGLVIETKKYKKKSKYNFSKENHRAIRSEFQEFAETILANRKYIDLDSLEIMRVLDMLVRSNKN